MAAILNFKMDVRYITFENHLIVLVDLTNVCLDT